MGLGKDRGDWFGRDGGDWFRRDGVIVLERWG